MVMLTFVLPTESIESHSILSKHSAYFHHLLCCIVVDRLLPVVFVNGRLLVVSGLEL